MNSTFDSKNKEDAFKETMYAILNRMTFGLKKKLEPNYYGFDAFAREGIYDNIPTVIEFFYLKDKKSKVKLEELNEFLNSIILKHRRLDNLKILFITNGSFSYFKLDNIDPKVTLEFWDKRKLQELKKEYPLELFYYLNNFKGISKYLTPEVFAAHNELSMKMFVKEASLRRVSIVLGAGVSKEYGALDLDELTHLLVKSLPNSYISNKQAVVDSIGKSSVSTITFVKESVGENAYGEVIYKALYEIEKKKITDEDTTLFEVAKLIKRHKRLDSIITFNYDDYLEQILMNNGIKFKYLYRKEDFLTKDLAIYHVHGFMPKNPYKLQEYVDSIILSEDELFTLYSDNNNWQVSVQLQKFKENLCLFIGSSLRDYNLKRCLQLTKEKYRKHYAIMIKNKKLSSKDMLLVNRFFNLYNVEIIWVDSVSEVRKKLGEY